MRRHPERGAYDRPTIEAILDEGLVCHVGIVVDGGPVVIPMAYGRDRDRLILHGAVSSRLLRALAVGCDACVTVTLLDGLVLARSTYHSSMNYRSVVLLGRARRIVDEEEKRSALLALTEHLVPGRADHARGPSREELAATEVLELVIAEASAKVRTGPPRGEPASDLQLPYWAGVVPFGLTAGVPEPAPNLRPDIPVPEHVVRYLRSAGPPPR